MFCPQPSDRGQSGVVTELTTEWQTAPGGPGGPEVGVAFPFYWRGLFWVCWCLPGRGIFFPWNGGGPRRPLRAGRGFERPLRPFLAPPPGLRGIGASFLFFFTN